MLKSLVITIITLCKTDGYIHHYGETNVCEEWYLNCIIKGKSDGHWTDKDIERCQNEKPSSF